jgi:hypothetical protein
MAGSPKVRVAPRGDLQESWRAGYYRNVKKDGERWDEALRTSGITEVPNLLLDHQHALDMSSTELVVLLHVLRYWSDPSELPRPDVERIAQAMDLGRPSVERSLLAIEKLGHLRATGDGGYDVAPLVTRLKHLASHS